VTGEMHPAAIEDVRRLWPAVSAAHIFDTREELERWWRDAPWRVRVTAAGEGAVLGRWRRDLDLLAVRGLWCAARRMPALIEGLRDVAKGEGFGRLLGPFVPEDAAGPYLASGMAVDKRIVVYRRRATVATFPLSPHPGGPPDQFTLREARPEDADAILRLDGTCFDSFWRYDEEHVTAALATGRGVLAEVESEVIGYTLCTLYGAEATVGRLAVATSRRGRIRGSQWCRSGDAVHAGGERRVPRALPSGGLPGGARAPRQHGLRAALGRPGTSKARTARRDR
jgi:hypothetical protein